MTQDEIIEMARQAGFEIGSVTNSIYAPTPCEWELEVFAKLVEDAAFARWALQTKLAVQDEREACAKVCYELPWKDMTQIPSNLAFAAAIRARSET
jgi:hypothetical protein